MSLYGKDDSNANKTKAEIGVAKSSQTKTIVFIDDTEAQLAENKARGVLETYWKVKMNRGKIPKDLRTTPALLRCQLNPLGGIK